ncbi:YqaE/Pmp3 family membrane protein [Actinoplanes sp. NPDC051411]|uniref:YqaE/Pmp3 family membrane protein n=1 Tax=Actinoplanes sp. NPDC051411 TaxID=3155522 RepID=UPI0034168A70
MKKILLIVLCLFFPFLAVLIHEGLTRRVLWAILFQLIGHIPGVIYGIYVVTSEPRR